MTASHLPTLTRRAVWQQAWPIMLGQAAIPLVGVVDAAVIGRSGDAADLAGVALGASVISMVFWAFGFLRMGVSGMAAQALGRRDEVEQRSLLLRGLLLGFALGAVLLVLSIPLRQAAFAVLAGEPEVTRQASGYAMARFLGAPAALATYALTGWLIGLGRTRPALVLQLVLNVVNAAASVALVWGLGLGPLGAGLGTAIADWLALGIGLLLAGHVLGDSLPATWRKLPAGTLLNRPALVRLVSVNADIMVRTLALLAMFTWFTNAGARLGAVPLAANHVLLQFIAMAAFVLDAFAFTAESRVGQAVGAHDHAGFRRAVRLTGEFSLLAGALLALVFLALGQPIVALIAADPGVRAEAARMLPFAAAVPLLGMPSWLLDGVFIGATQGRALRNAAVIATLAYLALDLSLRPYANQGAWSAFAASYLLRAGALGAHWPALARNWR